MGRLLEVCVEDAAGLAVAIEGGAGRIELCAALALDGLTPSAGLLALARDCPVPVHVLIRPRAGDFRYGEAEARQMEAEIAAVRAAGLAGVVLGACGADGGLDHALLARLVRAADGLSQTLHRAFDTVPDQFAALEAAIGLGFARILTSGAAADAAAGAARIAALHRAAAGRIGLLPGGGLRPANLAPLLAQPGLREFHASCSRPGAPGRTDPAMLRAMCASLAAAG